MNRQMNIKRFEYQYQDNDTERIYTGEYIGEEEGYETMKRRFIQCGTHITLRVSDLTDEEYVRELERRLFLLESAYSRLDY